MGQPIPEHSANEIRDTFARMSMNDSEAVALIGGGHSFGKTHGACNKGAGLSPKLDPEKPWPGLCGSGRGEDTYTSGFEFPWTKTPTAWNTEYFQNLILFPWKVGKGPGDRFQWRVEGVSPHARSANGSHRQNIGIGGLYGGYRSYGLGYGHGVYHYGKREAEPYYGVYSAHHAVAPVVSYAHHAVAAPVVSHAVHAVH